MNAPGASGPAEVEIQLSEGIKALGLKPSAAMLQKFGDFIALLDKWNRTYNLTATRDRNAIVSAHILDSIAAAPHLDGKRGIDVGSGGGFPGIPLAVALPESSITLLDSSQKKTAFLREAVATLRLVNAEVVCARVESWAPQQGYDWVISRAFSDVSHFVASAGHLALSSGVLVAMKGRHPRKEMDALASPFRVRGLPHLQVPGLQAERHLVILERR